MARPHFTAKAGCAVLLAALLLAGCAAAPSSSVSAPVQIDASQPEAEASYQIERPTRDAETPMGEEGTWTMLIYLCGSDLESQHSVASMNLMELMLSPPADNVKFVIQTGGSEKWGLPTEGEEAEGIVALRDAMETDQEREAFDKAAASLEQIDPTKLQRFVVTDELTLVDEVELANMGSADTLYDFLSWGVQNYPAGKMGTILWNHGGGSLSGVCFDELFEGNSLHLFELDDAFGRVFPEMTDKFEFIGFDTCLTATIETANIMASYGRYMTASQEVETGWSYGTISWALSNEPEITGAELGALIGETYYAGLYGNADFAEATTVSVVDLGKIDDVMYALNDLGAALDAALDDNVLFGKVSRAVDRSVNFYYDIMVDLGDMAAHLEEVLPAEAAAVLAALDAAVLDNTSGAARAGASGLSVFYPAAADQWNRYKYMALYPYCESAPSYTAFVTRLQEQMLRQQLMGTPLVHIMEEPAITQDGRYTMQINPDDLPFVQQVGFMLYHDPDDGSETFEYLGYDTDVELDAETGVVTDNFTSLWAMMNGQPLMLRMVDQNEQQTLFTAPVELNGAPSNLMLQWVWDETEPENGHYVILGAWGGLDPLTGMASRGVRPLVATDTVAPKYGAIPAELVTSEQDEANAAFMNEAGDLILLPGTPMAAAAAGGTAQVSQSALPAGRYYYQFVVVDVYGNSQTYVPIAFEVDATGAVVSASPVGGGQAAREGASSLAA